MARDETILDGVGVVCVLIAVAAFSVGYVEGVPIPKLLEGVSPILLLGVAAIAGVGAVVAFFRNR